MRALVVALLCVSVSLAFHRVGGGHGISLPAFLLVVSGLALLNVALVRKPAPGRTLLSAACGQLPLHLVFSAAPEVSLRATGEHAGHIEHLAVAPAASIEHPPMWLSHIGAALVASALVMAYDLAVACAQRIRGYLLLRLLVLFARLPIVQPPPAAPAEPDVLPLRSVLLASSQLRRGPPPASCEFFHSPHRSSPAPAPLGV